MKFEEAVRRVLNNYANFSGRARRSEYWYFILFNMIVEGVFNLLSTKLDGNFLGTMIGIIAGVYGLAILVPSLAVAWRRLHDTGRSGWLYLLLLIPLVGSIILLVFLCQDSQPGSNQYGPNPKEYSFQSYT